MTITIRERILQIVLSHKGINSAQLSARLATEFISLTIRDIMDEIDSMIKDGELVEIDFEMPGDSYSVRFYVPKFTKICIKK